VTVALPYPPPLHQNEGKLQKKIEIESVFHVFSTTLQKDELFSFWWPYLCPLALPNPFKPLRMNVNRHYYIKTRKQEKINSHPPQLQKKMCDQQKLNNKGQKRARDSIDLWPGGADISCALIRDEYEVQKFSWVDLLCFEKTMQLHSFTPVSVQYAVLVSGSLVNAVFQKCPLTHPPAHPIARR